MRKTLRIKVSVGGASPEAAKRLAVGAQTRLRKVHAILREALGAKGEERYCFLQDGRVFGNPALNTDYVENDATFSLRYCLCLPGHTVDYVLGRTKYTVELESIEVSVAREAAARPSRPLR